jgi:chemotaxis protein MotA
VDLLCGALRPIIDGKVKPDQLDSLIQIELDTMEEEHHQPVTVLTKAADAMPGFGIVAAVLGIVITMASIGGPPDAIGHHVAAALVGTFLGILVSYGFLNPLAVAMEFAGAAEMTYTRCIAKAVVGFVNGMAPIMAVELARRALTSDVKPSAEDLETILKGAK